MNKVRWIVVIWILALLLSRSSFALARQIAIIANKDYPSDVISADRVREIYLGEKLVESGVKLKPMEHNDDVIKRYFIEKVIRNTYDGYKAYWIKKFFQEGITPPTNKTSSSDLISAVSKTSGAIGYIWADEIKNGEYVKVLLKIEVGTIKD